MKARISLTVAIASLLAAACDLSQQRPQTLTTSEAAGAAQRDVLVPLEPAYPLTAGDPEPADSAARGPAAGKSIRLRGPGIRRDRQVQV